MHGLMLGTALCMAGKALHAEPFVVSPGRALSHRWWPRALLEVSVGHSISPWHLQSQPSKEPGTNTPPKGELGMDPYLPGVTEVVFLLQEVMRRIWGDGICNKTHTGMDAKEELGAGGAKGCFSKCCCGTEVSYGMRAHPPAPP